MNNNEDIKKKLIEKFTKKNISNYANKIFIDQTASLKDINNYFPSVRYTDNINNASNNIFNDHINLPSNVLKTPLSTVEETDLNIGDKHIDLSDSVGSKYFVSEESGIKLGSHRYSNEIDGIQYSDIKQIQSIASEIIKLSEDYRKDFAVDGKELETIATLVANGKNLDTLSDLKHTEYENIKTDVKLSVDEKVMNGYLSKKKVEKKYYKHLKKIYHIGTSITLYDLFNLNNDNMVLYLDKISLLNAAFNIKDTKKYTAPKTDLSASFFVIDSSKPILKAYEERFEYKDVLNISLKSSNYYGYHSVNASVAKNNKIVSNRENVFNDVMQALQSVVSGSIAKTIFNDCLNTLKKYGSELNYDILSRVASVSIRITHNTSKELTDTNSPMFDVVYLDSDKKLSDFDPSKDKLDVIKFFIGNFENPKANVNAFLHVKNKTEINKIGYVIENIRPISQFNNDFIESLKDVNVVYRFELFKTTKVFDVNLNSIKINYKKANQSMVFYDNVDQSEVEKVIIMNKKTSLKNIFFRKEQQSQGLLNVIQFAVNKMLFNYNKSIKEKKPKKISFSSLNELLSNYNIDNIYSVDDCIKVIYDIERDKIKNLIKTGK